MGRGRGRERERGRERGGRKEIERESESEAVGSRDERHERERSGSRADGLAGTVRGDEKLLCDYGDDNGTGRLCDNEGIGVSYWDSCVFSSYDPLWCVISQA